MSDPKFPGGSKIEGGSSSFEDVPADGPLAFEGGRPAVPLGPPPWPRQDAAVWAALEAAWRDGSWGRYHGPYGPRLARLIAERHGVDHALLCCSGTFAVELALRGIGIGAGDEVVVAGYDFAGNFRAIEAVGATPVLADITSDNWTLDTAEVARSLRSGARAIIASHLHGGLADMPRLRELADEHGAKLVEDVCQAPGANVAGRPAGAWGDVGVFSFGGSKLLTAGRGGAIITQDAAAFQRAKIFAERGNHAFPLSELAAALLIPQWERLDADNARRQESVAWLLEALRGVGALRAVRETTAPSQASYYKLGFLFEPPAGGRADIDEFVAVVKAEGVALDRGFRGFARRGPGRCRRVSELPNSRRAAQSTVVLHHPVLLESRESVLAAALGLRKAVRWLGRPASR